MIGNSREEVEEVIRKVAQLDEEFPRTPKKHEKI